MINASTNDCTQKNYLNKLNKHLKENRLIELVKIMINGFNVVHVKFTVRNKSCNSGLM